MPADTFEGKAEWIVNAEAGGQNFFALKFSGIWCDFWAIDLEQIAMLMKHLWGREFSRDELMQMGERIWNLGRLFNLREGLTIADDALPERMHDQRFAEGAAAGKVIDRAAFAAALQEYYAIRGWDAAGVPSEAKLSELGVDVRLSTASRRTKGE
jgi:aldehyde:ferredoxin oxidoreductase